MSQHHGTVQSTKRTIYFFGGRSLCKNLRKKIKYKRAKKEERRKNMLKREKNNIWKNE